MAAEPAIGFMIGGVQKGGTTALARYLAEHPQLALPRDKEAHVFDDPAFDEGWDSAAIDARFAPHFPATAQAVLRGDATPLTLSHQALVRRVARYNPAMRWVVLLRDPVERAISHYHMERQRGHEALPLVLAALLEDWRLRGRGRDWSLDSPLRRHNYAARGRYTRQLDALLSAFPPAQVLLLRSADLQARPAETVARVFAFLGVAPLPGQQFSPHFQGGYRRPPALSPGRLLLRWRLRGEKARLRRQYGIDLDAAS